MGDLSGGLSGASRRGSRPFWEVREDAHEIVPVDPGTDAVGRAGCSRSCFFPGGWMLVVYPPITMIAAILNLTLYLGLGAAAGGFHGPSWARILTGLAMALAIVMYMAATRLNPMFATRLHNWLPESAYRLMPTSLLRGPGVVLLDFALLDLLGFGSMIASRWFVVAHERSRKKRSVRSVGRSS